MKLTVATRRSALALAQTRAFLRELEATNPGLQVEELQVVTAGDRIQDRPLYEVGGKGLFVKEIEAALLSGQADFAIHSMKDLPAELPDGLEIACVPRRADFRDLLLVRPGLLPDLSSLPVAAKVGSSSLRRRLGLLALRPDLQVEPLRGNVDTRLRRLLAGDFDAILLAAAGLARLGIADLPPHAALSPETLLPAATQGILAIEGRIGDERVKKVLATMEHAESRRQATAERAALRALGADCTVPFAALLDGDRLRAWLWKETWKKAEIQVDCDAEAAGRRLGLALLAS